MKIHIIISNDGGVIDEIEAFTDVLKAKAFFIEKATEAGVDFDGFDFENDDDGELCDHVTQELDCSGREVQWYETELK